MSTAEDVGRDARDAVANLAAQVSDGLRRVSAYSVLFNQAIAERLGINATDLRCLDIISRAGPLTAGRLAELTSLTTGAITGVIDRLEQAGFAERKPDPTDRRRVIVGVVPGAMKRVGPLFAPLGEAMIEFCSRYSAEELATIVDFVTGLEPIMREETARVRAGMRETPQRETPPLE
jgi:DNA-binding MarR family transcriptional regulator